MSVQNFIPTLWSARLLANLDKAHVFGNVVNRDYEGEITKAGDSVKINQLGNVTIGDYTQSAIGSPEELTSSQVILNVDKQKYFNFMIDSVDNAQSNPKLMDKAMERASYGLSDVIDQAIAQSYLQATGGAIGSDASPMIMNATTAYDTMVDMSVLLDEKNAPSQGRFIVVPSYMHGYLLKDDRFIRATQVGDNVLATGLIGEVAGFKVYKSNNIANVGGAKFKVIAGHTSAIAFAQQVLEVQAYKPEARFGDAVKGLVVFGTKVVQPDALVVLTTNKA